MTRRRAASLVGASGEWAAGPQGSKRMFAPSRSFLLKQEIKTTESLLFAHGLSSATIARDGNGNPSLLRSGRGRIDLVSAAVLASGLRAVGRRLRVQRLSEVGDVTAMQRKRFYQTREWRSMSRHIRQRDGWLCTSTAGREGWRAAAGASHRAAIGKRGAAKRIQPHQPMRRMSSTTPRSSRGSGEARVG